LNKKHARDQKQGTSDLRVLFGARVHRLNPMSSDPPSNLVFSDLHGYLNPFAEGGSVACATRFGPTGDSLLRPVMHHKAPQIVKTKCRKCDRNELFNYLCFTHFHDRFTLVCERGGWHRVGDSLTHLKHPNCGVPR
jgi:hypothetical protein